MKDTKRHVLLLFLILLFVCIYIARGADDSGEIPCPDSCAQSRKSCEMSCSQIVGGGVESGNKRECLGACSDEEVSCNERCVNPTPRPTPKPNAYSDMSCSRACEYMNRDCSEECTRYIGGGAASVKRAKCDNECSDKLEKCINVCSNPSSAPVIDPHVYENSPCSGTCSGERSKCEATCAMYSDEGENGGKRGECMAGCKGSEYNCLEACPR